jgi:hypothetical protein
MTTDSSFTSGSVNYRTHSEKESRPSEGLIDSKIEQNSIDRIIILILFFQ